MRYLASFKLQTPGVFNFQTFSLQLQPTQTQMTSLEAVYKTTLVPVELQNILRDLRACSLPVFSQFILCKIKCVLKSESIYSVTVKT